MKQASDSVVFPTLVNGALATIERTPTGLALLQGISDLIDKQKFGYTVCIMRADMTYDKGCAAGWRGTNVAKRSHEKNAVTEGAGSVTAITFNANMINTPDGARPSWIGLAHELIHAYYNLRGEGCPSGMTKHNVNGLVEVEEMATVGLGSGPHRPITENMIRAEHNLPIRKTYGGK